jgi:hypothetical protein
MQNNTPKKIPALPSSWPMDKRARIRHLPDGRTIATHPARDSIQLVNGTWQPAQKKETAA